MGESMTWDHPGEGRVQERELTPEQAGYPRAAGLMAVTEQTIAKFERGD